MTGDNVRYGSWEGEMPTSLVNLDALIQREDFLVPGPSVADGNRGNTLRISDLGPGAFFYNSLRKPDFQRETANWSPEKIQDFVKTFLDGDLVPAIICWASGGSNVFVIDGAHRLSALIAWVRDDYGSGVLSRSFFKDDIPPEQLRAAERTRTLIGTTIGSYADHVVAASNPDARGDIKLRATRLGSFSITVQWVPSSEAKKAEAAFFKINQAATQIDPTELRILHARFSPTAICSRVIVRNATGHKYWGAFPAERQDEVEKVGKDIYRHLFTPPLDTPIRTLDLPVAGRGYSGPTLPLIFDLVSTANDLPVVDIKKGRALPSGDKELRDDDGTLTIKMLKRTQGLVHRMTGLDPASLGLHPAVYFYSATGRYQPTAFLAMATYFMELGRGPDGFHKFTKVRAAFEEFLIKHKNFINELTKKFGSGPKGYAQIVSFYRIVVGVVEKRGDEEAILRALDNHTLFKFLAGFRVDSEGKGGKGFSAPVKSLAFLREALANPIRCSLCRGLIHFNSIHVDHIKRRADGGLDVADNARIVHPFCNTSRAAD